MRRWILAGAAAICLVTGATLARLALDAEATALNPADPIKRGRYLVQIGGCNDCHTADYLAKAGDVPENRWLTGSPVGFSGPWGTTYPGNLRHLLAGMEEDSWVRYARTIETRPPMPWFNLRVFAEDDLRAIYRYVRSMPADDSAVPDYVPPDGQPATPHIVMVPQAPKQ
ncbi:MAG: hypothetical protein AB7S92_13550 [Parvibaculaceae bacterium]